VNTFALQKRKKKKQVSKVSRTGLNIKTLKSEINTYPTTTTTTTKSNQN